MKEADTKARIDSIYANLDYYKLKALYNTSLFLMRRILLAFVIVYLRYSIVMQVAMADVLSTALLAYYIQTMPMADSLSNGIQIFNEVVVLVCTWLLFQSTLYVTDAHVRYDQANYFLAIAVVTVCINVLVLFFIIFRKVY